MFVAFCHSQIGSFFSINGQNDVIFGLKYLKIGTSEYSEIWQFDRTWICDKNVPSGFLKKILNLL